jgi:hypothetical protein
LPAVVPLMTMWGFFVGMAFFRAYHGEDIGFRRGAATNE